MGTDMSESKWQEVGSQVQVYWTKIDDADLVRIAGKAERLSGVLQYKYGYTKQYADIQSIRWMRKHGDEQGIELEA